MIHMIFDLVIECFPPKDIFGLYYRGKHGVGANGVCKNWKDTNYTYLKHHQNFCRRITTTKLGVYCVSAVDDTVQTCPVSKCSEYFRCNINSRNDFSSPESKTQVRISNQNCFAFMGVVIFCITIFLSKSSRCVST